VIINSSFGRVIVPLLEALTAVAVTKRDSHSSATVRSADSAIEAMRQGQARGKATNVPEVGCGLPRRLTDRKTAGELLRQVDGLSIENLRHQAEAADKSDPTVGL
jgi:hypothetical protein